MDSLLELVGVWLARAYAFYGIVVLAVPLFTFLYVVLLVAVVWLCVSVRHGRHPLPRVPLLFRRWARLAVSYRDVEPVGDHWNPSHLARTAVDPPFPVTIDRRVVAKSLLDSETNIATCAVILALYQNQWEGANRAWSIRARPDILATLYQIGFARSNPHGAPQSNAFGKRVRRIYEQPWLGELLDAPRSG